MQIDPHDEYRHLGTFYSEAEALITAWPADVLFGVAAASSGWSPGQHLYHLAKANGSMLKAAQYIGGGRPPVSPSGSPTPAGSSVLETGRMPRGQAQAPGAVVPPEAGDPDDLRTALARSRQRYDAFEPLLPELVTYAGRLPHPFLGQLNALEWLRLARIHADHHLAIAHEVAAALGYEG